jgi:hypothetical protein
MSRRATAWFAWLLWAICVALDALAVLLDYYTSPLPERGIPNTYALFAVPLLVYATVGAVVASRRPKNPIGWILCTVGFVFGVQSFATAYADYALLARPGSWLPGAVYMASISQSLIGIPALALAATLLILLFPDGRVSDRSFWFVPWMAVGVSTTWALWVASAPEHFDRYPSIVNAFRVEGVLGNVLKLLGNIGAWVLFIIFAATVFSLFVRRANADVEQRQQIKWFAYAGTALLACFFLYPWIVWEWPLWVGISVGLAGLSAIPVAVGIAILRYRLYDIDRLINGTLVYASLTAILVGIYFGGVTATQALFHALTSQEQLPQLVVVASTLVIAALFNPLRHRIQSFIDRSFYRRKYDAAKTLEEFSMKLRDETDLEAVSDDLVGVVRETMQPAHVSLWLRPDTPRNSKRVG